MLTKSHKRYQLSQDYDGKCCVDLLFKSPYISVMFAAVDIHRLSSTKNCTE